MAHRGVRGGDFSHLPEEARRKALANMRRSQIERRRAALLEPAPEKGAVDENGVAVKRTVFAPMSYIQENQDARAAAAAHPRVRAWARPKRKGAHKSSAPLRKPPPKWVQVTGAIRKNGGVEGARDWILKHMSGFTHAEFAAKYSGFQGRKLSLLRQIEALLLMSGIEPNPGPDTFDDVLASVRPSSTGVYLHVSAFSHTHEEFPIVLRTGFTMSFFELPLSSQRQRLLETLVMAGVLRPCYEELDSEEDPPDHVVSDVVVPAACPYVIQDYWVEGEYLYSDREINLLIGSPGPQRGLRETLEGHRPYMHSTNQPAVLRGGAPFLTAILYDTQEIGEVTGISWTKSPIAMTEFFIHFNCVARTKFSYRICTRSELMASLQRGGVHPNPGPRTGGDGASTSSSQKKRDGEEKRRHLQIDKKKQAAQVEDKRPAKGQTTRDVKRRAAIAQSAVEGVQALQATVDSLHEKERDEVELVPLCDLYEPACPCPGGYVAYSHSDPLSSDAAYSFATLPFPLAADRVLRFTFHRVIEHSDEVEVGTKREHPADERSPQQKTVSLARGHYHDIVYVVTTALRPAFAMREENLVYGEPCTVSLPLEMLLDQRKALLGCGASTYGIALESAKVVLRRYYPDPASYLEAGGDHRMRWLILAAVLYLESEHLAAPSNWTAFLHRAVFSTVWGAAERALFERQTAVYGNRQASGYYIEGYPLALDTYKDLVSKTGSSIRFYTSSGRKWLGEKSSEVLSRMGMSRARWNGGMPLVLDSVACIPALDQRGLSAAFLKRLSKQTAPVDERVVPFCHRLCSVLCAPLAPLEPVARDVLVTEAFESGSFDGWSPSLLVEAHAAGEDFINFVSERFLDDIRHNGIMVKNEILGADSYDKGTRFVVCPPGYVRAYSNFVLRSAAMRLSTPGLTLLASVLVKHLTREGQQAKVLERLTAHLVTGSTCTTDISSMESQVRGPYLVCDEIGFLQNCSPDLRVVASEYFAVRQGEMCSAECAAFRSVFGPCRISGSQETSVGNCISNVVWQVAAEMITGALLDDQDGDISSVLSSLASLSSEELSAKLQMTQAFSHGMFEGDDGLMPAPSSRSRPVYVGVLRHLMGVDFKLEDEGKFCGVEYLLSQSEKVLAVVDPRVIIAKLSVDWNNYSTTHHDPERLAAKALSFLETFSDIPIIRTVCREIVMINRHRLESMSDQLVDPVQAPRLMRKLKGIFINGDYVDEAAPEVAAHIRTTLLDLEQFSFTEEADAEVNAVLHKVYDLSSSYLDLLRDRILGGLHSLQSGIQEVVIDEECPLRTAARTILTHVPDVRAQCQTASQTWHASTMRTNLLKARGISGDFLISKFRKVSALCISLFAAYTFMMVTKPFLGLLITAAAMVSLSSVVAMLCILFGVKSGKSILIFLFGILATPAISIFMLGLSFWYSGGRLSTWIRTKVIAHGIRECADMVEDPLLVRLRPNVAPPPSIPVRDRLSASLKRILTRLRKKVVPSPLATHHIPPKRPLPPRPERSKST
jgi:hypothetical protein